jgi:hypothetical protein
VIDVNPVSSPQLHVVVQVEVDEDCDWIPRPKKPWPTYVRLWRETEPDAVALVVGTLATWGREKTEWSVEALDRDFPCAVPGGFAAVDQEKLIAPGCCCGLETWKDWLSVLSSTHSPWMGHDPSPFVEVLADRVSVWADGGLGGKSRGGSPIVFSWREFESAVRQAATDLSEFEEPLRKWLSSCTPRHADSVVAQFRQRFIHCQDELQS